MQRVEPGQLCSDAESASTVVAALAADMLVWWVGVTLVVGATEKLIGVAGWPPRPIEDAVVWDPA